MKDWIEVFKLILNKFDIKLIYSLVFTGFILLTLNKTKYPMLFDLPETNSGCIKFYVIIVFLFSIVYVFCDFIFGITYKIKSYIEESINQQQNKNKINLYLEQMGNNPEVYWLELRIIKELTDRKMQECEKRIIGKLIAESLKSEKKNNNTFFPLSELDLIHQLEHALDVADDALNNLKQMQIIEYTSYYHFKINDDLYNELVV